MYERKKEPIISLRLFTCRVFKHVAIAALLLIFSLAVGMGGYVYFEKISVVDAFLNAAMLLGGMGSVNAPVTASGKLFAGIYALYAGLVFIVTAALIFTPVAHRVLHGLHIDDR